MISVSDGKVSSIKDQITYNTEDFCQYVNNLEVPVIRSVVRKKTHSSASKGNSGGEKMVKTDKNCSQSVKKMAENDQKVPGSELGDK